MITGRSTRSKESTEFIKRCISHCDAHRTCQAAPPPDGSQVGRPARLLDAKATRRYHGEEVLCTKLVEPDWVLDSYTYVTFSHCWGTPRDMEKTLRPRLISTSGFRWYHMESYRSTLKTPSVSPAPLASDTSGWTPSVLSKAIQMIGSGKPRRWAIFTKMRL